ncbi:MAG: hypothetical protein LIO79_07925 [Rikenellaceae bacterium]|nr:hypothetical protein [Rikenellaceae bacterium]
MAHSFLFEIDEVLKQKTENCFTRWMDDVVFSINSRKEAIETISSVSDMLKSRGLALNLAKTAIYDHEDGRYHFQIDLNRYIDSVENTKATDPKYKTVCSDIHKKFKAHFKDRNPKYWDKIAKRYITTYSKLNSRLLLNILSDIYLKYPGLRINLVMYLSKIGYCKKTSEIILEIIDKMDIFDDISLYQICHLVSQWEIPVNEKSKEFLSVFEGKITSFSFKRKVSSDFFCVLWFKTKYNHHEDLMKFIDKYKNLWQTDSFLRRQVTAVLSRLLLTNTKAKELLYTQLSSGILNSVTLSTQIFQFAKIEKLDKKLTYYLFPEKLQRPYPLGKFMVLCSILNSEKIRTNAEVKKKIRIHIKDPYFLKWLDVQYNIS